MKKLQLKKKSLQRTGSTVKDNETMSSNGSENVNHTIPYSTSAPVVSAVDSKVIQVNHQSSIVCVYIHANCVLCSIECWREKTMANFLPLRKGQSSKWLNLPKFFPVSVFCYMYAWPCKIPDNHLHDTCFPSFIIDSHG